MGIGDAEKLAEDTIEIQVGKPLVSAGIRLGDIDGRGRWAKRVKALKAEYTRDLGDDNAITAAQRSLVARAAVLTCELEAAEAEFAEGGKADADRLQSYRQSSSELRRLLDALGAKRADSSRTPANFPAMSFGEGITLSAPGPNGEPRVLTPNEIEVARRLIFAINQSVENSRPMHPALAAIAVGLGLASLPPGQTLPDIATDDTTTEDTNADD